MYRIGFGTDVHRLVEGRPLIIGGVRIESGLGADGHSDADVLMHAATDAVLGALALGDIGTHFPSDDERWRDAESTQFLEKAIEFAHDRHYSVANIDCTIDLETPKLKPNIERVRANLAAALGVGIDRVSVKAKTGEAVDAVGEGQAIRAQVVVLLEKSE